MEKAFTCRNEFAAVRLELDQTGNGPRIKVVDLKSGKASYFDPLELESIVWATHKDLSRLLDPSQTRWRSELSDIDLLK